MKKFTFTVLFTLLTASVMMSQPLIPSAHGLDSNQPAWNEAIPQVQEYTLTNGFAWWSSYIDLSDNGLSRLENALNQDASLIKNATAFVSKEDGGDWTGTLQGFEEHFVLLHIAGKFIHADGGKRLAVSLGDIKDIHHLEGWHHDLLHLR